MQISLITFFITGFIFSALAVPLIRRKIKINNWYGIRLPQTMENEKVWYEVNSIMGKYLFGWGIFILCVIIYYVINPTNPEYLMVYVLLVILIMGTILFVIRSFRTAARISQKYIDE